MGTAWERLIGGKGDMCKTCNNKEFKKIKPQREGGVGGWWEELSQRTCIHAYEHDQWTPIIGRWGHVLGGGSGQGEVNEEKKEHV